MSNTGTGDFEIFRDAEDIEVFRQHLDRKLFEGCCTLLACCITKRSFHIVVRQDVHDAVVEVGKAT